MKRNVFIVKVRWPISIPLTVAALAASYYLYQLIQNWLNAEPPPFFTFFPVMMLITIILGRWHGLFYTVLSIIVVEYWIFQPHGHTRSVSLLDIVALGLYFAYCLMMIFLVEFSRHKLMRVYQLEAMRARYEVARKFEAALSSMIDAVVITDAQGNFIEYNDTFATLHGYSSKSECPKSLIELRRMLEICHVNGEPLQPEQWSISMALAGEMASNVERRIRCRNTGKEWVGSFNFSPIRDEQGVIVGSVVVVRDVTKEKRIIEELEASNERYRAAFHVSQDGLVVTRAEDGMIQDINDRIIETFGYTREELVGKTTVEIGVWPALLDREQVVAMLYGASSCMNVSLEVNSKSGVPIQTSVAITRFRLKGEECLLTNVRDMTRVKRAEDEIKKLGTLAYYDPLTGLANRRLFIDRMVHCIQRSERSNQINGLVYLDVNHFKDLNDQHGHSTGDEVLCEYARRLKTVVRKADTVARIGGDEFVLLLENLGTEKEQAIEAMAGIVVKLEKLSEEPMRLPKLEWMCTSSMGVKLFSGDVMSAEQVLEAADMEMYKRKMEAR